MGSYPTRLTKITKVGSGSTRYYPDMPPSLVPSFLWYCPNCRARIATHHDCHINERPHCLQCNAEMERWLPENFMEDGSHPWYSELDELRHTLELIRKADMRGIQAWRAEAPQARDLQWPDRAELIRWLFEKINPKEDAP